MTSHCAWSKTHTRYFIWLVSCYFSSDLTFGLPTETCQALSLEPFPVLFPLVECSRLQFRHGCPFLILQVHFLRPSVQPFFPFSTLLCHYFLFCLIPGTSHNVPLPIWLLTFTHSRNTHWLPTVCPVIQSGKYNTHDVCLPLPLMSSVKGRALHTFANQFIAELIIVPVGTSI